MIPQEITHVVADLLSEKLNEGTERILRTELTEWRDYLNKTLGLNLTKDEVNERIPS